MLEGDKDWAAQQLGGKRSRAAASQPEVAVSLCVHGLWPKVGLVAFVTPWGGGDGFGLWEDHKSWGTWDRGLGTHTLETAPALGVADFIVIGSLNSLG